VHRVRLRAVPLEVAGFLDSEAPGAIRDRELVGRKARLRALVQAVAPEVAQARAGHGRRHRHRDVAVGSDGAHHVQQFALAERLPTRSRHRLLLARRLAVGVPTPGGVERTPSPRRWRRSSRPMPPHPGGTPHRPRRRLLGRSETDPRREIPAVEPDDGGMKSRGPYSPSTSSPTGATRRAGHRTTPRRIGVLRDRRGEAGSR
jgi:hypothetical protein